MFFFPAGVTFEDNTLRMKTILFAAALFFAGTAFGQEPLVTRDANGHKVVRGFMTQQELASDTAFSWYGRNISGFTPDAAAVQAFKNKKDNIHIIAFGGTWCEDTQNLLPKFFALANASGFPAERVTLLGVDLEKKAVQHFSEALGVTRVPTFIVMKDGKEVGRVVEWGKYGQPDKELGEIVSSIK